MRRNLWLKNDKTKIDKESTEASLILQSSKLKDLQVSLDKMFADKEINQLEYEYASNQVEWILRAMNSDTNAFSEEIKEASLKLLLALAMIKKKKYEKE